ncbi:homoserine O-acetyltransferase [Reichenbachiella carrageenanivorans]|uniref:Homoserine O-acetyltransferase n=1 Tax=Reichenbachiella carrageenanivorans TaxID=2979869 RepID=A0ABY6D520_9BACT|nr:homoserine O-acetyltransferase [Reichenbachiella carrageenanivorans]UXX81257.1 homoserine O-acetyltransferase [Reichenbachiella carrageenanivorans]
MSQKAFTYEHSEPFQLERGGVLPKLEIAYHTFGQLNADKSNVVWVFHALTANSDALDWWKGLFDQNSAINPEKYFIVCANILGSPYGTSSPMSTDPVTGKPYHSTFPLITIRDMVEAHKLLRDHLGIEKIAIGLGGSMGGFQTYEWAVQESAFFEKLILVATAPKESPWRISVHAAQRLAIEADPTWKDDSREAGAAGVAASRAIGMLSYRNHEIFEKTQSDAESKVDDFRADSYIRYQGNKLANRGFSGFLLWNLTKALDSHDLSRDRGTLNEVLEGIRIPVLQVGIISDLLFPIEEQRKVADHLANVTYKEIESLFGHDGFLTETKQINQLIAEFLA